MVGKFTPFTFVTAIGAACGGLIILKDNINGPLAPNQNFDKDTVLITGGNRGLGKAISFELAKRNACIILGCRDLVSCEQTKKTLIEQSKNTKIYCASLDLSSLSSVKSFIKHLGVCDTQPNILINNAGVINHPLNRTNDDIEYHFATNYIGHFLLTYGLIQESFKQNSQLKIVNIIDSSYKKGLFKQGDTLLPNTLSNNEKDPLQNYCNSKLALVFMSQKISQLFTNTSIYCVDPGLIRTEFRKNFAYEKSFIAKFTWKPLFDFFAKDASFAAQSVIYALLNPENQILDTPSKNISRRLPQNYVHYIKSKGKKFVNEPLILTEDQKRMVDFLWDTTKKYLDILKLDPQNTIETNS